METRSPATVFSSRETRVERTREALKTSERKAPPGARTRPISPTTRTSSAGVVEVAEGSEEVDDRAEGAAGEREPPHVGPDEAGSGVGPAGRCPREERGGEIDARDRGAVAGEDDGVPAGPAGQVEDPAAPLPRVGAEEAEDELGLPLGLEVVSLGVEGEVLLAEPARVPGVSLRLGVQARR